MTSLSDIPSSKEAILALADIDPEWKALKDGGMKWPKLAGPYEDIQESVTQMTLINRQPTPSGVIEKDFTIKNSDGHELQARSYAPVNPPASGSSPVVLMFHGGGFILGNIAMEDSTCRAFVQRFGATCVSAQYRLAPQHPFPAAINDGLDVLKWVAANYKTLSSHADPVAGFIVGGTSAGGRITDVLGHLARDQGLSPPLTGLLEMIPGCMSSEHVPEKWAPFYLAWEQNKDADLLGRDEIIYFRNAYKPSMTSTLAQPFYDPKGHKGLPPIAMQVCGMDPMRDDALIYTRALLEAGQKVKLLIYPGVPHGFWKVAPKLKVSEKLMRETVEAMEWLLQQSKA